MYIQKVWTRGCGARAAAGSVLSACLHHQRVYIIDVYVCIILRYMYIYNIYIYNVYIQ